MHVDTIYRPSSYYGYGNGTIWLDYLHCTGSETKLINCSSGVSIGATNCGYNKMAGVFCACKKRNTDIKNYDYNFSCLILLSWR